MTATVTPRPGVTPGRIHGLDALRGGALLLGIVLHGLLAYVPGFPWIVMDTPTSAAAGVVSMWIHMFRMPLFMFLAGYFARMSLGRRGTRAFVVDRAKRILLPLVVFAPLMLVCMMLIGAAALKRQGGALPPQPDVPLWLLLTSPGHLWFLWTLVQLYAVVLIGRAIARRLPGAERLGVRLGDALTRPGGVLLPAATYAVALQATGRAVGGPTTLVPEWPSTVAFLGAFLAGWFCWGLPEALPRLQRAWAPHLGLALALTVLIVVRLGATIDMEARITPWWLRLAYAVAVWAWCYGLLGLATRVVVRENAAARYLADASYWMYIIHLPLVLLAQLALVGLPLPLLVKAVLVVGVPTVVLLASYHLLVRSTWLGRWLNGRAYPFRWGIGRGASR